MNVMMLCVLKDKAVTPTGSPKVKEASWVFSLEQWQAQEQTRVKTQCPDTIPPERRESGAR